MNDVEFLIDNRIPEEFREVLLYYMSPLICRAAKCGDLAIFKLLIEYGCTINSFGYIIHDRLNIYETSTLGIAASSGCKKIVKYILEHIGQGEIDLKCT